jgi:hypothetical protein
VLNLKIMPRLPERKHSLRIAELSTVLKDGSSPIDLSEFPLDFSEAKTHCLDIFVRQDLDRFLENRSRACDTVELLDFGKIDLKNIKLRMVVHVLCGTIVPVFEREARD